MGSRIAWAKSALAWGGRGNWLQPGFKLPHIQFQRGNPPAQRIDLVSLPAHRLDMGLRRRTGATFTAAVLNLCLLLIEDLTTSARSRVDGESPHLLFDFAHHDGTETAV